MSFSRARPTMAAILATTALASVSAVPAVALAAEPIKLTLRGYYMGYVTLGKIDRDIPSGTLARSYRPETLRYEGEVWFTGETKLDNGTMLGIRVELEAWSQNTASGTADQIDEEYLYAFGDWGRIEFGATDAASYKMVKSTPSVLPGWGFQDPTFANKGNGFAAANDGGRAGVNPGLSASLAQNSGDATKVTYFTPAIAGFQIGVSYTPSFSASGLAATCSFRGGGGPVTNCPEDANAWRSGIDLGTSYVNKFGDVSVALYGGYMTAGFDRGTAGLPLGTADSAAGRYKSWAAGAQIGLAGVTLGGGLGRDNNGLKGSNATRWFSAGIRYETGPWQMSVGWWGGRNNDGNAVAGTQNAPGKDKEDIFEAGLTYLLSPGVKLVTGLNYVVGSGQSKSEKADSWALLFGTDLRF